MIKRLNVYLGMETRMKFGKYDVKYCSLVCGTFSFFFPYNVENAFIFRVDNSFNLLKNKSNNDTVDHLLIFVFRYSYENEKWKNTIKKEFQIIHVDA